MILGHASHPDDGGSKLFRNVGALIYYTVHETKGGPSTGQQPSCMPENIRENMLRLSENYDDA